MFTMEELERVSKKVFDTDAQLYQVYHLKYLFKVFACQPSSQQIVGQRVQEYISRHFANLNDDKQLMQLLFELSLSPEKFQLFLVVLEGLKEHQDRLNAVNIMQCIEYCLGKVSSCGQHKSRLQKSLFRIMDPSDAEGKARGQARSKAPILLPEPDETGPQPGSAQNFEQASRHQLQLQGPGNNGGMMLSSNSTQDFNLSSTHDCNSMIAEPNANAANSPSNKNEEERGAAEKKAGNVQTSVVVAEQEDAQRAQELRATKSLGVECKREEVRAGLQYQSQELGSGARHPSQETGKKDSQVLESPVMNRIPSRSSNNSSLVKRGQAPEESDHSEIMRSADTRVESQSQLVAPSAQVLQAEAELCFEDKLKIFYCFAVYYLLSPICVARSPIYLNHVFHHAQIYVGSDEIYIRSIRDVSQFAKTLYQSLSEQLVQSSNYYLLNEFLKITLMILSNSSDILVEDIVVPLQNIYQTMVNIFLNEKKSDLQVIVTLNLLLNIATKGEFYCQVQRFIYPNEEFVPRDFAINLEQITQSFVSRYQSNTQYVQFRVPFFFELILDLLLQLSLPEQITSFTLLIIKSLFQNSTSNCLILNKSKICEKLALLLRKERGACQQQHIADILVSGFRVNFTLNEIKQLFSALQSQVPEKLLQQAELVHYLNHPSQVYQIFTGVLSILMRLLQSDSKRQNVHYFSGVESALVAESLGKLKFLEKDAGFTVVLFTKFERNGDMRELLPIMKNNRASILESQGQELAQSKKHSKTQVQAPGGSQPVRHNSKVAQHALEPELEELDQISAFLCLEGTQTSYLVFGFCKDHNNRISLVVKLQGKMIAKFDLGGYDPDKWHFYQINYTGKRLELFVDHRGVEASYNEVKNIKIQPHFEELRRICLGNELLVSPHEDLQQGGAVGVSEGLPFSIKSLSFSGEIQVFYLFSKCVKQSEISALWEKHRENQYQFNHQMKKLSCYQRVVARLNLFSSNLTVSNSTQFEIETIKSWKFYSENAEKLSKLRLERLTDTPLIMEQGAVEQGQAQSPFQDFFVKRQKSGPQRGYEQLVVYANRVTFLQKQSLVDLLLSIGNIETVLYILQYVADSRDSLKRNEDAQKIAEGTVSLLCRIVQTERNCDIKNFFDVDNKQNGFHLLGHLVQNFVVKRGCSRELIAQLYAFFRSFTYQDSSRRETIQEQYQQYYLDLQFQCFMAIQMNFQIWSECEPGLFVEAIRVIEQIIEENASILSRFKESAGLFNVFYLLHTRLNDAHVSFKNNLELVRKSVVSLIQKIMLTVQRGEQKDPKDPKDEGPRFNECEMNLLFRFLAMEHFSRVQYDLLNIFNNLLTDKRGLVYFENYLRQPCASLPNVHEYCRNELLKTFGMSALQEEQEAIIPVLCSILIQFDLVYARVQQFKQQSQLQQIGAFQHNLQSRPNFALIRQSIKFFKDYSHIRVQSQAFIDVFLNFFQLSFASKFYLDKEILSIITERHASLTQSQTVFFINKLCSIITDQKNINEAYQDQVLFNMSKTDNIMELFNRAYAHCRQIENRPARDKFHNTLQSVFRLVVHCSLNTEAQAVLKLATIFRHQLTHLFCPYMQCIVLYLREQANQLGKMEALQINNVLQIVQLTEFLLYQKKELTPLQLHAPLLYELAEQYI